MDASATWNDGQHARQLSLAHYRIAAESWNRSACLYRRITAAFLASSSKAIESRAIEEPSDCITNVSTFSDCARELRYRPGLRDSDGGTMATCCVAQVSSLQRGGTADPFL